MQEELDEGRYPFGNNLTKRFVSEGGECVLYSPRKVSGHGEVTLVDYMGGDDTIEMVATAGRMRKIFPEKISQADFLGYLAEHGIHRPFKFGQLKYSFVAPIEVAFEFVYDPNGTGNEYSGRYSDMLDTADVPDAMDIYKTIGRQYSGRDCDCDIIAESFQKMREKSVRNYRRLLELGLARELARGGLGTDNDTKFFWKIDILSLSQLVKRVGDYPNSIGEMRKPYIKDVAKIAESVFPNTWKALTGKERRIYSLTLPRDNEVVDGNLKELPWRENFTRRVTNLSLEEILFVPKKFLGHGELQVFDYMGNDNSLAEAARTSYGKGTKKVHDNVNLIRSLVRDEHTTPTEMAEVAFINKVPVFVDPRQAGRHRTLDFHGFMGYVPKGDEFYMPPDEELQAQDSKNRQGRAGLLEEGKRNEIAQIFKDTLDSQLEVAGELRKQGCPEEFIRDMKGVFFYTIISRTGDPHNFANYLKLRLDAHAQKEIREQAQLVAEIYERAFFETFRAQKDYKIDSERFSRMELEQLGSLIKSGALVSDSRIIEELYNRFTPSEISGIVNELSERILIGPRQPKGENIDANNLDLYSGREWIVTKQTEEKELGREGMGFQRKLKRILGQ